MIIKRIKLHNWKNFQNCEVMLSERCLIIGSNASGKSNFIDSLRFLRDIVKQSGGLQTAVKDRGGITKIRCLAARSQPNISIEVDLGDANESNAIWRYSINFVHTGGGIRASEAKVLSEQVFNYQTNRFVLNRSTSSPLEDEETLKYTHLEQVTANKNFRELHAFFSNIEYLNVVPQLVRESASISHTVSKEDYFGRNFLERLSKLSEVKRNAYFKKINEVLKIAVPQLQELSFVKDNMGVPHLEAKYLHWRARGSKQQEGQFSDGTLRLIGFLFALIDGNGVILLEEPEINLHSGIVALFPEFIAKMQRQKKIPRQVFITTHSYDLLSNPGISTDEVIVLKNTSEGTIVSRVSDIDDLKIIVDAGLTIADAVIPFTKPHTIDQILQMKIDF